MICSVAEGGIQKASSSTIDVRATFPNNRIDMRSCKIHPGLVLLTGAEGVRLSVLSRLMAEPKSRYSLFSFL